MKPTILTPKQSKSFHTSWEETDPSGEQTHRKLSVTVRHDDSYNNGHNTFSITGTLFERTPESRRESRAQRPWDEIAFGCLHDEIKEKFPDLAPLIKWHLCSTDGPMHYIANSLYWAGQSKWNGPGPDDPPNLKHFHSVAIWPEATQQDMENVTKEILEARLPKLMEEFQQAVESLGFVY